MYNFFFIKNCGGYQKLPFSDIIYVEAENKYIKIITENKPYLISATMSQIEKALPYNQFRRIHRSYIVSFLHISCFDYNVVYLENKQLPIGRQYKTSLLDEITVLATDEKNGIILPKDKIKTLSTAIQNGQFIFPLRVKN
ncbi:MAG TPA: LytTR family DNA-binding domain-containing protein [Chitinophagaceae bacterium]|jgi:two-component system LytT family response regulator|nr:LytTR family DNA-binding domain-containing protein [Chitinophagaceae bacterium]